MSLPLTVRKNIRDSDPKQKEHLEKIKKATGKEWTFESDWGKIVAAIPDNYKDSVGSTIQDECLGYLADNLENLCKNESSKEAFVEATNSSKITFRHNPKLNNYWVVLFENGDLVVEFKSFANTYEIRNFNIVNVIPTPGLPLKTRLNIEENKEKLDAAMERIVAATGEKDWALEVDYEKSIAVLDNWGRDSIGEVYREVMENFATLLERKLTDETVKESFNEASPHHKVVIRVNDKASDYWTLQFVNGEIVIEHKKSLANLYQITNIALEKLIPSPGGLSLVQRLNIQQHKAKMDEHLELLKNVTGGEWVVEVDYEKIVKDLEKNTADYIGDTYQEAIGYFSKNVEKLMGEGDTVKEAFLEATPERKVTIQLNDKAKDYWVITFKNGGILLEHRKSIANLYQVSNIDLKPLIPSPGGLSLVTRVNIEQNKEKIEDLLQEIAKAAGTEDWTFEPDYEKAVKEVDDNNAKYIGDTYREALEYLKDNIKTCMEKETIKEAFAEVTPERKIVVRVNDKATDYWVLKFENGGILIEHKKNLANLYQIRNINLPAVLPVPGVLSLLARLNIQDNREKMTEALERIKNATGEEYTFDETCIEDVYTKLPNVGKDIGDLVSEVLDYVSKLIEKNMQDEMTKEAFNEVSTSHQVTIKIDPKQNGYWIIKLENGNVAVYGKSYANLYEIQNFNLEKLL